MYMQPTKNSLLNSNVIYKALITALLKFDPREQKRNPVMFSVYIGSLLTTALFFLALFDDSQGSAYLTFSISFFLWATIYFANFSESLAEERSKAQADALHKTNCETKARKLSAANRSAAITHISAKALRIGDYVLVEKGDVIPSDGEIIEGTAAIDESVITGESAPVIRSYQAEINLVTGGSKIVSDWLIVRITKNSQESFLQKMIALVEGAQRQKTPNEIALSILLIALTIIFLLVCTTLLPFSSYSVSVNGAGKVITITTLIALFVCLAPTTIGGLLSAIGIAGINRMLRANVIAVSGRAIEAAGDADVLLFDKTGTITVGNRQAIKFIPAENISAHELAEVAYLASLADETAEGASIVALAEKSFQLNQKNSKHLDVTFIPFTAETRMSGIDFADQKIRKGSVDAIEKLVGSIPKDVKEQSEIIARQGGTPLLVAKNLQVLGVIYLKDIVKPNIRQRFLRLKKMGIKTIMITGDNPLTAATIAKEAGVDDFLANATPLDKLNLIKKLQAEGHLVAMTGDGTNDAPALAQADVGLAMASGTQAAKEAGNMVDLDSNPTKLLEIIAIGKQLLITRGALTTFSIANDIAKYFAILPAAFASTYPQLNVLNIMHLATPQTAILSAVIFNALIIVCLTPLALHGIKYKQQTASYLLRTNLLIYGLGGLLVPFIGIKAIDLVLNGSIALLQNL